MKNENQSNETVNIPAAPAGPDAVPPARPGDRSRPRRAAGRRMRRRSPQSKAEKQESELCHRPKRARRASPFEILPEFAQLSPADLAEVHDLIRDFTAPEARKFIFERYQISLPYHALYRYRARLDLADQLQIAEDNAPAIQNLLSMLAGKHVDLDRAGIHIIKQRAVSLAANPNSSPSLLKDLFRIFTYKDRLSLQQRRVKCHERMTKVTEKRQKLAEKKQKEKDNLMTMEEQSEAARELFGAFPPPLPYEDMNQNTTPVDIGPTINGIPVDPNNPVIP